MRADGESADDAGTRLISLFLPVEPLDGVVRADAPPMLAGHLAVRQRLGEALAHDLCGLLQPHRLELGCHRLGLGRRGESEPESVPVQSSRSSSGLGFPPQSQSAILLISIDGYTEFALRKEGKMQRCFNYFRCLIIN